MGRHQLDMDFVIPALLRGDTCSSIAKRESQRLGIPITKNTIIGVKRDLKNQKMRVAKSPAPSAKTFIYGQEENNGGLPLYIGHLEVELSKAVVINDLHLPYMDYDFAARVGDVVKYYGIRDVVVAGDVFHGEQKSPWRRKSGSAWKTTTLRHDINQADAYFTYLAGCGVQTFYMYPGNHDAWLTDDWYGDLAFADLISMMHNDEIRKRTIVTPYDRMTVWHDGHKWVIPHQAAYSVYNLAVGNDLAQKFQANIITTHQHTSAQGWDRYNRYVVIDSGGLHHPDLTPYLRLKTTKYPEPKQGFVSFVDGAVDLWTPDTRTTNWSKLNGSTT